MRKPITQLLQKAIVFYTEACRAKSPTIQDLITGIVEICKHVHKKMQGFGKRNKNLTR